MKITKKVKRRLGRAGQRFLVLGLEGAGKRTALASMGWGRIDTLPHPGFNLSTCRNKESEWMAVDLGDPRATSLVRQYYPDTTGLIYVVDASDRARMEESRAILHAELDERTLRGVPLLFMANKQDREGVMSMVEITDRFGLFQIRDADHSWLAMPTNAIRGDGIAEGLTWLSGLVA